MGLTDNIRQLAYNKALKQKQEQNKIQREPFQWKKAKRFVLLLHLSESAQGLSEEKVKDYAERLGRQGKEVTILAYTPAPQKPEGLGFECLCKKDLNWAKIPKGPIVEAFLSQKFDVLIHTYFQDCSPLDFLSQAAKVGFRVGYYQAHRTHLFDLMLHNPAQDIEKMIEQIEPALKLIN